MCLFRCPYRANGGAYVSNLVLIWRKISTRKSISSAILSDLAACGPPYCVAVFVPATESRSKLKTGEASHAKTKDQTKVKGSGHWAKKVRNK